MGFDHSITSEIRLAVGIAPRCWAGPPPYSARCVCRVPFRLPIRAIPSRWPMTGQNMP
ncbi:MAG: hypothetical protein MZV64_02310 [Ignavibacteriales bacterium]|nr:hypothetical protein [Ignavibacteriales bacterium]